MTKILEAVVRRRWLPPEYAVREVVAFERRFGEKHLALACHAALPLILTPELVNLIRINFLDSEDIPWIAESDLLLSPLCRPIQEDIYEVEPCVREVLLVELEDKFGWRRQFQLAELLQFYLEKQPDWKQRPELTRTQKWIAKAYLNPDATIQEITDDLEKSLPQDNPVLGLPGQSYIPHLVEILAEPLERTNLWEEHQYLVNTTRALAKLISGEGERLREEIGEVRGGELGEGEFVLFSPAIEKLLADSLLELIGNETDVDILINALNDEDSSVRNRAADALGNIGSERAVDTLINALNDEDSSVRNRAADALGNIGSERAVDALINALNHEDSSVRNRAADALGNIASSDKITEIWQLVKKGTSSAIDIILKIQERCKFYNHDIFHSPAVEDSNVYSSSYQTLT